jgi:beta-lactamase superfamily II metal-dependent hydrolase
MKVTFLKAYNGDSIWISSDKDGKTVNILIDGGTSTTYSFKDKKDGKEKAGDLKLLIESIKAKNEFLDLVVLTHIDDDHIDGFLKWFSRDKEAVSYIKELWFNSGRTIKKYLNNLAVQTKALEFSEVSTLTSVAQGVDFEKLVKDNKVWNEEVIKFGDNLFWNDMEFEILTPNEDNLKLLLEKWEEKDAESTRDTSRKLNNQNPLMSF